jgi:hypothetical protein
MFSRKLHETARIDFACFEKSLGETVAKAVEGIGTLCC